MGTLPKVLEELPDPDGGLEDGTGPEIPGGLSQLQEALDLVAADVLWQRFPDLAEGELTRLRASLVAEVALAEVAQAVELGRYLYLGRGDLKRGAREQPSTLADAVEAVLGAVFLDARAAGGRPLESATAVFERLFAEHLARVQPEQALDAKSRLQHWAQARYRVTPTYIRIGDKPPPGDPCWRARVELRHPDGTVQVLGEGEGRSLKKAEQRAATAALRNAGVD
jgi:ribonuclease-3